MSLILAKHQSQNQYYEDTLAEGVRPLRMMLIPAGSFLMGSPETELERSDDEGPQHQVTLSQFFMGKYPITQAQWRAVAAMPQVDRGLSPNSSRFQGDDRPVEQASWYDAVEFCARLTIHTNRRYRLPTEAEWEYACRAGTTTPFHFGETITTDLANYNGTDSKHLGWTGSYGEGPRGEYRKETMPVNQLEGPNEYGLCDMHGNVWEWCQDQWHDSYEGAPINGSAWIDNDDDGSRVLRGGSWSDYPRNCRSATRVNYDASWRLSNCGFRVVCVAPRTL